jgi:hypothetical protein
VTTAFDLSRRRSEWRNSAVTEYGDGENVSTWPGAAARRVRESSDMTHSSPAAGAGAPGFCPACSAVVADGAAGFCTRCGLDLAGPRARELRFVNAELARLASMHAVLMARRNQILAELSDERAAALAGVPAAAQASAPGVVLAGAPAVAGMTGRRGDSSGRAMAHLLLAAGGIMLGLSVVAFTVANWARIGPAGRVAILLAATAVVLAAPVVLARRQLRATAESVAAVGLMLTLADAYLIYRLISPVPGGGAGYAAMASAAMSFAWLAYGRLVRLAGPVLGAIMIAQFPLVLAAIATFTRSEPAALALLGTSVGDSVLVIGWAAIMRRQPATMGREARAVGREAGDDAAWPGVAASRILTMVMSGLTGIAGFLIGLAAWSDSPAWPQAGPGWSTATWISVVFAAAAVATALAVRAIWSRWASGGIAVAGGLAAVAAGIALASALPAHWSAVAFGGASAVVIAVVALITRNGRLADTVPVAFGAAVILGLAEPAALISASGGGTAVPWLPMTFVVITALAASAAVAATVWRGRLSGYDALLAAAPLVLAAAITSRSSGPFLAVGPGQHLTGPATLAVLAFVSVALTVAVAWRSPALASAALGSWSLTVAVSLTDRSQALATLGLAAVAAAGCAWRARQSPVRAGAAFGAVLGLGAFGHVLAEAAGLHPWITVLAVLGIAALAQLIAWRLRGPLSADVEVAGWRLVSVGVEAAGWLLTAIAVAAAAWIGVADESAPILLTATVLCLTASARRERQHALWPGLVLGAAALLTWLAGQAPPAPEPWTLPAAALVLCLGWLAQRRSPTLASWPAFGLGLAVALVPSLAAAWIGHGALRPLLLGLAAAAIAVAGARARLQAPAVLGALVAVLDGARQVAPVVTRLVGALPNWAPVAVIGAVLIWAGGTYEARLRDLRKIGRTVGGMH